jgi:hypothetical protein
MLMKVKASTALKMKTRTAMNEETGAGADRGERTAKRVPGQGSVQEGEQ